ARAGPVGGVTRAQRFGERFGIHMGDHENLVRSRFHRDGGDEPVRVEFGCKDRTRFAFGFGERLRIGKHVYRPARIRAKKRSCSWRSSAKTPVKRWVTVDEPCFCTPRMDMHICSASSITAAPRGLLASLMASMIWAVRFSWVCKRLANTSVTRASFESPTTPSWGR